MKISGFQFSRPLVLVLAGVILLGGGSGAAAVYLGGEKLLGSPAEETGAVKCTLSTRIRLDRPGGAWLRHYISVDASAGGPARVATALAAARSLQEEARGAKRPALVQVSVLAGSGPKDIAQMRGRAIGAQVTLVAEPARLAGAGAVAAQSAFYIDGKAGADGRYYGERVELQPGEIEAGFAALRDVSDCEDPNVKPDDKGKKKAKEKSGGKDGGKAAGKAHGDALPAEAADPDGVSDDLQGEGVDIEAGAKPQDEVTEADRAAAEWLAKLREGSRVLKDAPAGDAADAATQ